ncbi:MAG: ABC transporter permease [Deltaproteobacteria bacterium]|nr:ABC transporter permease [Deltaproteobacteria bacterium]
MIRPPPESETAVDYRYVLKELRHHHHRTLVNVLGIAVGIALFVSINAISTAYQKAVSLPFKNLSADLVVQRPERRTMGSQQVPETMQGIRLPISNQLLSSEDLQKLSSIEGVGAMASSLLLWEFDQRGFRTIMGVDLSQPNLGPVKVRKWLKEGRFPRQEGEVVLENHYAMFHHTKLGARMKIKGRDFTVVGLLEIKEGSQIASANIYLPLADARNLLSEGSEGVNVVYLRLRNPSLLSQVKTRIAGRLGGVSVTSSDSFLELMGGVSKILDQFSLLISIIALAGAISLIIKSMLANLVARSSEIGILKAVGWTERDVQKQLIGEALLQSFAGGIFGLIIGYGVSYLLGFASIPVSTPWEINLLPALARNAENAVSVVRLPVSLSPGLATSALALSLLAGALASYFMGRRTSRMKPVDILRRL